jgi:hypothetical protein
MRGLDTIGFQPSTSFIPTSGPPVVDTSVAQFGCPHRHFFPACDIDSQSHRLEDEVFHDEMD